MAGGRWSDVAGFFGSKAFSVVLKLTNLADSDDVKVCRGTQEAEAHFRHLLEVIFVRSSCEGRSTLSTPFPRRRAQIVISDSIDDAMRASANVIGDAVANLCHGGFAW